MSCEISFGLIHMHCNLANVLIKISVSSTKQHFLFETEQEHIFNRSMMMTAIKIQLTIKYAKYKLKLNLSKPNLRKINCQNIRECDLSQWITNLQLYRYMSVSLTFSSNSNTSPNDSFFCQKQNVYAQDLCCTGVKKITEKLTKLGASTSLLGLKYLFHR